MDNIEQLKQDNEKLKERLNNAAKFFRDQKAQIEALTKENEDLKEQVNVFKNATNERGDEMRKSLDKCKELEKTIESKDQAYQLLQDTYNVSNTLSEICNVYMNYLNSKKFIIQKNTDSVPNVVDDLPELSFTPLYPIRIFGTSGIDGDFTKCKARMYEIQITQGNQIILDLIPVRKNGIGYMYDKISKRLYGNDSTGEFILGPDK